MKSDPKKKGEVATAYTWTEFADPDTRPISLEETMMLGLDESEREALREHANPKVSAKDRVVVRHKEEPQAQDFTGKNILYASEAAKYLRVSYQKILELIRKEQIPNKKVGRRYLFKREDLDKWLSQG